MTTSGSRSPLRAGSRRHSPADRFMCAFHPSSRLQQPMKRCSPCRAIAAPPVSQATTYETAWPRATPDASAGIGPGGLRGANSLTPGRPSGLADPAPKASCDVPGQAACRQEPGAHVTRRRRRLHETRQRLFATTATLSSRGTPSPGQTVSVTEGEHPPPGRPGYSGTYRRFFAGDSASVGIAVGAQINHSGVPGQGGAAMLRIRGRTRASCRQNCGPARPVMIALGSAGSVWIASPGGGRRPFALCCWT